MVMGLAALYKKTQQQEVSIFEIDFSNMRGTNEHNEKVIKAAYPDLPSRDASEAAMDLTDQYSFLVASVILKSVESRINADRDLPVRLIPLRTGGDEVRVVAINMSSEEAQAILPAIHDEIEATTASLALHDHPHAKRPLDNLSNGFGAAGATFLLEADGQFNDAIAKADRDIAQNKIIIGQIRAENGSFAALKPPEFDLQRVYSDPIAASRHLDYLHETMSQLRQTLGTGPSPKSGAEIVEYITQKRMLGHIPGKDEIQQMMFDTFLASMRRRNITLTTDQQDVLKIKVLKFPQNDPSSGTLSSRDFPAMAGVAMQVVQNMNDFTRQNEHLWTMGVSFHNLSGLNETLGHGYSNLILHEQAAIIRRGLHSAGLADRRFQMAHMGNGDFHVVVQPLYIDGDLSVRRVTAHDMNKVTMSIEDQLKKLNATPVEDFLKKHGVTPPANLPPHFADIENPRDITLPGLRASISAKPYETDALLNTHGNRQGGAVRQFIGEHLLEMTVLNKAKWAKDFNKRPDFSPGMGF
jgi:GGDEF domain-containing protein